LPARQGSSDADRCCWWSSLAVRHVDHRMVTQIQILPCSFRDWLSDGHHRPRSSPFCHAQQPRNKQYKDEPSIGEYCCSSLRKPNADVNRGSDEAM
jgi:hypothetical protein